MVRFVCNHQSSALQKFVLPNGRVLTFERGVLDTDDEGAKVIRANPLFGRTIFEGDPEAPAHSEIPTAVKEQLAQAGPITAQAVETTRYCSVCDETFASDVYYRRHMRKTHGEEGGS